MSPGILATANEYILEGKKEEKEKRKKNKKKKKKEKKKENVFTLRPSQPTNQSN